MGHLKKQSSEANNGKEAPDRKENAEPVSSAEHKSQSDESADEQLKVPRVTALLKKLAQINGTIGAGGRAPLSTRNTRSSREQSEPSNAEFEEDSESENEEDVILILPTAQSDYFFQRVVDLHQCYLRMRGTSLKSSLEENIKRQAQAWWVENTKQALTFPDERSQFCFFIYAVPDDKKTAYLQENPTLKSKLWQLAATKSPKDKAKAFLQLLSYLPAKERRRIAGQQLIQKPCPFTFPKDAQCVVKAVYGEFSLAGVVWLLPYSPRPATVLRELSKQKGFWQLATTKKSQDAFLALLAYLTPKERKAIVEERLTQKAALFTFPRDAKRLLKAVHSRFSLADVVWLLRKLKQPDVVLNALLKEINLWQLATTKKSQDAFLALLAYVPLKDRQAIVQEQLAQDFTLFTFPRDVKPLVEAVYNEFSLAGVVWLLEQLKQPTLVLRELSKQKDFWQLATTKKSQDAFLALLAYLTPKERKAIVEERLAANSTFFTFPKDAKCLIKAVHDRLSRNGAVWLLSQLENPAIKIATLKTFLSNEEGTQSVFRFPKDTDVLAKFLNPQKPAQGLLQLLQLMTDKQRAVWVKSIKNLRDGSPHLHRSEKFFTKTKLVKWLGTGNPSLRQQLHTLLSAKEMQALANSLKATVESSKIKQETVRQTVTVAFDHYCQSGGKSKKIVKQSAGATETLLGTLAFASYRKEKLDQLLKTHYFARPEVLAQHIVGWLVPKVGYSELSEQLAEDKSSQLVATLDELFTSLSGKTMPAGEQGLLEFNAIKRIVLDMLVRLQVAFTDVEAVPSQDKLAPVLEKTQELKNKLKQTSWRPSDYFYCLFIAIANACIGVANITKKTPTAYIAFQGDARKVQTIEKTLQTTKQSPLQKSCRP